MGIGQPLCACQKRWGVHIQRAADVFQHQVVRAVLQEHLASALFAAQDLQG